MLSGDLLEAPSTKMLLWVETGLLLGYVVSKRGLQVDTDKVSITLTYPLCRM